MGLRELRRSANEWVVCQYCSKISVDCRVWVQKDEPYAEFPANSMTVMNILFLSRTSSSINARTTIFYRPLTVNVLPDPVCPYTTRVPMPPERAKGTRWDTAS